MAKRYFAFLFFVMAVPLLDMLVGIPKEYYSWVVPLSFVIDMVGVCILVVDINGIVD